MYVHVPSVHLGASEVRRGYEIPWKWSHRIIGAARIREVNH